MKEFLAAILLLALIFLTFASRSASMEMIFQDDRYFDQPEMVQRAKDLHASVVRIVVYGNRGYATPDQQYENARAAGLKVLVTITPKSAYGPNMSSSAFKNFVRETAHRYDAWAYTIVNEPEHPAFYGGYEMYKRRYKALYSILRSQRPHSMVMYGDGYRRPSTGNTDRLKRKILAVHPYATTVGKFRAHMKAYHRAYPRAKIYITEFGAATAGKFRVPADRQAALLRGCYKVARHMPYVKSFSQYGIVDDGLFNTGLYDQDLNPKDGVKFYESL